MPLFEYKCTNEACGETFETLVKPEAKDEVNCPSCDSQAHHIPSLFASWTPSRERTNQQLKKRSSNHTARKLAQGGEDALKENDSYRNTSDSWHSKTRSKVQGHHVIDQHANDHKLYTPDAT